MDMHLYPKSSSATATIFSLVVLQLVPVFFSLEVLVLVSHQNQTDLEITILFWFFWVSCGNTRNLISRRLKQLSKKATPSTFVTSVVSIKVQFTSEFIHVILTTELEYQN